MPLRLDVKKKLLARSDRVKCVDLHPTETWMLVALYNGNIHVWNYENQQLVKSFEVCELPVRCAKFIPRKNWIITGSDDMHVRVFNYNTLERVHQFEAHSDYLRSIAVHPSQPFVLTSSDDMLIKLWDWDNKWSVKQTFEGHTHYVMQLVINPKDNNTFATASLDKTVKVWQFGSSTANFTLEGHEKGVNCVDYYHGGDRPYLISGADDRFVKIWDYQNKTCVATLDGHAQNVSAVCFHPELPVIITGSEDSTVRLWHASTYRLETTLNYGLERVWCIYALRGSNTVAIGYDEGSVTVKLGREEPAVSMDSSGKILWAKHSEMQQANLKTLDATMLEQLQDGERISLSIKDVGSCEIYPQTLAHNSNGRYVVACGDGEYIVYTAMALRNKAFGSGLEFVWSTDPSEYAVRESASNIKIFKNFKEVRTLRPDVIMEGIEGGPLVAARSLNALCFYDWETGSLIRRIEISAKHVYWSDNAEMVAIASDDTFYILKYNKEAVENVAAADIDGIEDAFDVIGEVQESIKTAIWIGDCFIFTTDLNRLNYYVGGEIVTIAHMDRPLYLLGYTPMESRLYLCDKDHNIVSYRLLLSVLEYQTAVMRRDFVTANTMLPVIPRDHRTRVAHFLEKQGFKKQALVVSQDPDHRFELALSLGDLKLAYDLAVTADSEEKWRQLSQAATLKSELMLAGECLGRARDYGGLLLLATSAGSATLLSKLASDAQLSTQHNSSFLSYLLLGNLDRCLEILISTDRLPEATFFAHTYCPSQVDRVVSLWKEKISRKILEGQKNIGESLAEPSKYPNLFSGFSESLKAERFLKELAKLPIKASAHPPTNAQRNILEEMAEAEKSGTLIFHEDGTAELSKNGNAVLNSSIIEASIISTDSTLLSENAQTVPNSSKTLLTTSTSSLLQIPSRTPFNSAVTLVSQTDSTSLTSDSYKYLSEQYVRTKPISHNSAPLSADVNSDISEDGEVEERNLMDAGMGPDIVRDRARPDIVPSNGGPDVVGSAVQPQPEVVQDAEIRSQEGIITWSDDEDEDQFENDAAFNIDDLNLENDE
ncbi:coatomer subunit beta' family protein [Onchocerca flexuosa]|uniref:Beta'-coat protein n=1 Tax=Onchocerca flexuosa TaxID=387005 RepID=A0A238BZ20_9BILA|nr:coatomer subunit beta' family protein [Onchocerca flexuosa]